MVGGRQMGRCHSHHLGQPRYKRGSGLGRDRVADGEESERGRDGH